ncbi:MAG: hypothetical protein ABW040_06690 [Microbacteriaceae bacterium]
MTDRDSDRRVELIAAAAADALHASETVEFDALVTADPSVADEVVRLRADLAAVSALRTWRSDAPSDALRARIAGIPDAEGASDAERAADAERAPGESRIAAVTPLRPRRRGILTVVGAAACLAAGAGLALGAQAALTAPPSGPPGTLGAVEHVDFAGEPDGTTVDGDLIAHTWGTETLLRIDGAAAGESFSVVVIDLEGREYDSGTFIGSTVTIVCQVNAAVLRDDVASVEIRTEGGDRIATAVVPTAEA